MVRVKTVFLSKNKINDINKALVKNKKIDFMLKKHFICGIEARIEAKIIDGCSYVKSVLTEDGKEVTQILGINNLYNPFVFSYQDDYFILFIKAEEEFPNKEFCLTWDDLYVIANNAACGSPELKAKDKARETLRDVILFDVNTDIETTESAEEAIDAYLHDADNEVFFNINGTALISKFVITVDSGYIRDAQIFNPDANFDFWKEGSEIYEGRYEESWKDVIKAPIFIDIIEAASISCAKKIASEKYDVNINVLQAKRV